MNELYSNGLHHGSSSVEIGNKDLSEERSLGLTLSYVMDEPEVIHLEAEAYHTSFNGFIYLQPVKPATLTIRGAFPTFKYLQADADLFGVDFSGSKPISKRWDFAVGGSVVRAYNRSNKSWISQMPSDRVHAGLNWDFTSTDQMKVWGCGISLHHVFKQTRGTSNDYVGAPGSHTLVNLDFSLRKIFRAHPIDLSLGISNLFNVKYRDYLNRNRYFADEEGVSLTIRLRKSFGSVDQWHQ